MTVAELIAALQKFPPDTPVLVYPEGPDSVAGFTTFDGPETATVKPRPNRAFVFDHASADDPSAFRAVFLR